MSLKKATEQERLAIGKAARLSCIFYISALIIWLIYDLVVTGSWEIQVLLITIGNLIFFSSQRYFLKKNKVA
ncbi:hypothetical protein [Lysinibacillus piscis]|uniref:Uncharacterized protein n=1 Tax=Lysinibacillus piscis TaxID=2518931 RepID=A0ABQ5NQ63_9BACI|nr:hypothetical protein [Lysinibacillus sp. KH24]GLC90490.1 hypothetical protein LYSBPC_36170 [Lysinibacillus sp. KH24]